jgi:hypothetical protein
VESFHLYVYTLLEKESGVSDSEKRSRKPVTVLLKQTLKGSFTCFHCSPLFAGTDVAESRWRAKLRFSVLLKSQTATRNPTLEDFLEFFQSRNSLYFASSYPFGSLNGPRQCLFQSMTRLPASARLADPSLDTLADLTVPTHRPLVPAISTIPALKTRFLTGQQQDAHEFMSYLLDILETEELAPPPLPPQQQASNQQPLSASRSADGRPLRRSASSRGAPPPRNSLSGSPNSAMALLPRKPVRYTSKVHSPFRMLICPY